MKLFDKIKDLFMDDVVEDDEIELEEEDKEIYKEPEQDVLPKVMRDNILKEEKKIELNLKSDKEFNNRIKNDEISKTVTQESIRPEKKFTFPMDIENDIPKRSQENNLNKNVLDLDKEPIKRVSELYSKKDVEVRKPKFKASPVISPVYGILDKNYSKEEVKERIDDSSIMKRPSKKVDFETVRKKAFGNLADEIKDNMMCENCVLYQEAKKNNRLEEDDLLYDMTVDNDEMTMEKADYNYEEFGVAYEPKGKHEGTETDIIVNNNNTSSEELDDDIAINKDNIDKIKLMDIKEESDKVKVDDDFFDLIDSMYKERSDE